MDSLSHHDTLAERILIWIDDAGMMLRDSIWGEILEVNGVDVWDVIRSPLYIKLLNAARDTTELDGIRRSTKLVDLISGVRSSLRLRTRLHDIRAMKQSSLPRKAKVIFWPVEPTHIKVQMPVARVITSGNGDHLFVCNRYKVFTELTKEGFSPVYLQKLFRLGDQRIRRDYARLKRTLSALDTVKIPEFPINRDPSTIWLVIKSALYVHMLPIVKTVLLTERLLEVMSPDVLVVGNDLTLEGRIACAKARSSGIPSVCLMHGNAFGPLHKYHVVDRFLAFGRDDK